MPRFEVVSAPLEERVTQSISAQAHIAAHSARHLLQRFHTQKTTTLSNTHAFFADEARLHYVFSTAATLLLPNQLPGFLLVVSLVLKLAHVIAVRHLAKHAVQKVGLKRE
jgi:hypothetical protein